MSRQRMATQKFHHGNLRADMIALATADLVDRPAEDISMRDLAERLGVSTAAPYRHFASKDEFLEAVASAGLADMADAYRRAAAMDAPPRERLRIACLAYLDLARANPGLFALLFFTRDFAWTDNPPGQRPASAFAIFETLVANACEETDAGATRLRAVGAWSTLHGFAMLRARGRIERLIDIDTAQADILNRICGS